MIPVRSFNEKLRLMFRINPPFKFFQPLGTFIRFNWQITVKSKTLSVESRSHYGKNDGRRPYQRNNLQIPALGNSHNICSRVSYGRTTSLWNHAHGMTFRQRIQISRNIFRWSMLVQRIKRKSINVNFPIYLFQKTTCRTDIFHNKMLDFTNDTGIISRQDFVNGRIAQCHGQQI